MIPKRGLSSDFNEVIKCFSNTISPHHNENQRTKSAKTKNCFIRKYLYLYTVMYIINYYQIFFIEFRQKL